MDRAVVTAPLTDEQRQRLAVLYDVWSALHIGELDSWDLIRCAHWVWRGEDMPTTGQLVQGTEEALGPDVAQWFREQV